MRKFALALTVVATLTVITYRPAVADFGSLLGNIPFLNGADEPAAETPSEGQLQLPAPPENSEDLPTPPPPAPEALRDATEPPRFDNVDPPERPLPPPSSPRQRSRSPIPPPHVPDDSEGFKSDSILENPVGPGGQPLSMIESDAETAIVPPAANPSAAHPQQVDFGQLFDESCDVPSLSAPLPKTSCSEDGGGLCRHHRPCAHAVVMRPPPTPYVYSGAGLPAPASLASHYRTPECYRGVWDGYAEEKYRCCEHCHRHLHGHCECHQSACAAPCLPAGDNCLEQPLGTCAESLSAEETKDSIRSR